jgi:hypothetical protein
VKTRRDPPRWLSACRADQGLAAPIRPLTQYAGGMESYLSQVVDDEALPIYTTVVEGRSRIGSPERERIAAPIQFAIAFEDALAGLVLGFLGLNLFYLVRSPTPHSMGRLGRRLRCGSMPKRPN